MSTCARLRWLLSASLIPSLLRELMRREGAERGPCNWERIERERIERQALAKVPAHPSLYHELVRLAGRLAHKHPGLVFRVRWIWLSTLPPARLLPPLLALDIDRVVRLELEVSRV